MCAVSFVGDHYNQIWEQRFPSVYNNVPEISRLEFDSLKREVEDMKKLLTRAKEYDEQSGQPDCEMEDKVAILKKVAKLVGIDLSDIFPAPTK